MPAEAFDENELQRLAAFRTVARQVRDSSIINEGRTVSLTIFRRRDGVPIEDDTSGLLPTEPLRSLVIAIRLAYQDGEPAHFFGICNLLGKGASPTQIERINALRAAWRKTKEGPGAFDYILEGEQFTDGEIFHAWLYGIVAHQDADKKKTWEKLDQAGAFAALGVQGTALQLAGRILDLDDVVAEILGQEPVERIAPPDHRP